MLARPWFMTPTQDEALVTSSAPSPDAPTLSEVYHREAAGLVRLAYLLLGDQQAAQDVVQDAFLQLHRRGSVLRDPSKIVTYLRSSVLNGSRSLLRRTAVRRRLLPARAEHEPSSEDTAVAGDDRRLVVAALRRLPKRQREVLVLRYWLDASEAEIADLLGTGKGTVKSSASRGMASLRTYLQETQP